MCPIFIELPETTISFVKKASSTQYKKRFYRKRGCIKTSKHAEIFHTSNGYEMSIVTFLPTFSSSK